MARRRVRKSVFRRLPTWVKKIVGRSTRGGKRRRRYGFRRRRW